MAAGIAARYKQLAVERARRRAFRRAAAAAAASATAHSPSPGAAALQRQESSGTPAEPRRGRQRVRWDSSLEQVRRWPGSSATQKPLTAPVMALHMACSVPGTAEAGSPLPPFCPSGPADCQQARCGPRARSCPCSSAPGAAERGRSAGRYGPAAAVAQRPELCSGHAGRRQARGRRAGQGGWGGGALRALGGKQATHIRRRLLQPSCACKIVPPSTVGLTMCCPPLQALPERC